MKLKERIADFIFSGRKAWKDRAIITWFAVSFCLLVMLCESWLVLIAIVSLALSGYCMRTIDMKEGEE